MRLTRVLRAYWVRGSKARAPQDEKKVPFQPILPLKLRNKGLFCLLQNSNSRKFYFLFFSFRKG
jgi:hypothetical protein